MVPAAGGGGVTGVERRRARKGHSGLSVAPVQGGGGWMWMGQGETRARHCPQVEFRASAGPLLAVSPASAAAAPPHPKTAPSPERLRLALFLRGPGGALRTAGRSPVQPWAEDERDPPPPVAHESREALLHEGLVQGHRILPGLGAHSRRSAGATRARGERGPDSGLVLPHTWHRRPIRGRRATAYSEYRGS